MLAIVITSILLLVPSVLASGNILLPRQADLPTFPPLLPTDPCTPNCTSTYKLITGCATSPDPACGCNDLATTAASCMQCLQSTNSTFGSGVFNYDYLRSSIAGCSCETPECTPIGSLARLCLVGDPYSTVCTCRAFAAYGSKCSQCLRGVDPYVADLYDKTYVPGCVAWEGYVANFTGVTCGLGFAPPVAGCSAKASAASSAAVTSAPSSTASPSGVVTFTSGSTSTKVGLAMLVSLAAILVSLMM